MNREPPSRWPADSAGLEMSQSLPPTRPMRHVHQTSHPPRRDNSKIQMRVELSEPSDGRAKFGDTGTVAWRALPEGRHK